MGIQYKNNPSFNAVDDVDVKQGVVVGYASTFNVKDSDNETILPGAFKNTINQWRDQVERRGSGRVKMLRDHDVTKLIGVPTKLSEDDNGLKYEAKITQKTALGRDTLALIEDGIITEHSFGYKVYGTTEDTKDASNTFLTELGLWEISYVTFGSNSLTPIIDMKSVSDFAKEREHFLDYVKRVRNFIKNGKLDSDEMIDLITVFAEQLETKLNSLYGLNTKAEEPIDEITPEASEDTEREVKPHSEEKNLSIEELADMFAKVIGDGMKEENSNPLEKTLPQDLWTLKGD